MLFVVTFKKKVIVDADSSPEALVKAKNNEIIKEDLKTSSVKPITNSEKIWYGLKELNKNNNVNSL